MTAFTGPIITSNIENDNNNDMVFPQPRVERRTDSYDDSFSDTATLSDSSLCSADISFPFPATFPIANSGLVSSSTLTLAQDNRPPSVVSSTFGGDGILNILLDSLRLTQAEDTVKSAIECLGDLWRVAKNPFEPRSQFELVARDAQVLIQQVIQDLADGDQSATKETVKNLQHFVSRINQIISEYKEGAGGQDKSDDFDSIMACICAQNLTDAISAFKSKLANEGSEDITAVQRGLMEEKLRLEQKTRELRAEIELLRAQEEEKKQAEKKRREENATNKEIIRILEEEMERMRVLEAEWEREQQEEAERLRKQKKARARARRLEKDALAEKRRMEASKDSTTPLAPASNPQTSNTGKDESQPRQTVRPEFVFISHQTYNYNPMPQMGVSLTQDGISLPGLVMNRDGIFMSPGVRPGARQWGPYPGGHYNVFRNA